MGSPGSCKICDNKRIADINQELNDNEAERINGGLHLSVRQIARRHYVNPETLRRHREKCLGMEPMKPEAREEPEPEPEPEPMNTEHISITMTLEQLKAEIAAIEKVERGGSLAQNQIALREYLGPRKRILQSFIPD